MGSAPKYRSGYAATIHRRFEEGRRHQKHRNPGAIQVTGRAHAEITTSTRGRRHRCVFERRLSFLLQQNNTPTQRPKNTHNESRGALNVLCPSCVSFVAVRRGGCAKSRSKYLGYACNVLYGEKLAADSWIDGRSDVRQYIDR